MTSSERRIATFLALGLGTAGLLLDFTGWYTIVGGVFGILGVPFALLMPRGRLRRRALWLNLAAVAVAGIVVVAFLA